MHGGRNCTSSDLEPAPDPVSDSATGRRAMAISVGVAVLMLVGKCLAFFVTGSVAILSDAAESVVHIVATLFSALGFRIAERPADEHHPYGHGKVVVFSIGFEGALIFATAIFVFLESLESILAGAEPQQLGIGLLLIGFLGFVNLWLGAYLVSTGKRIGSPVLVANGHHVLTDMWTSFAVVAGVACVYAFRIPWLDGAIGLVASLHILVTGVRIMREAVNQAMDEANPEATKTLQQCLDAVSGEGLIAGYHQLRHRRINNMRFVELHMLLPGDMSVQSAHERATEVERRIEASFPKEQVFVTSHVEPENHAAVHPSGHRLADPLSDPGPQ